MFKRRLYFDDNGIKQYRAGVLPFEGEEYTAPILGDLENIFPIYDKDTPIAWEVDIAGEAGEAGVLWCLTFPMYSEVLKLVLSQLASIKHPRNIEINKNGIVSQEQKPLKADTMSIYENYYTVIGLLADYD